MDIKSKDYQEHEIFERIEYFMEFYDFLSDNVMLFVSMGTKSIINIETYMFMSMKGTLDSIKCLLKIGRINDAYALLRKFYDSIYINVYTTLYLQDNFDIKNFIVLKIQKWLEGAEQLPSHREISNYIRDSAALKNINAILYRDKRYNKIRDICNDNTHYNFYQNVLLNDNRIYISNRIDHLNGLYKGITQLMIMHVSYIFILNDHYMSSSDYRDHLEVGMSAPKDSEYWVASSVQEFFDSIIKKNRPDLADLIKSTITMHLN
ncbi:hypothetical protein [Pedobacter antarcticus]|uniref:hypothetical protein n=1 Tax=Pedobacter antarcticus TaxID=34086 RepID=UPI00292F3671|nr:hypothetical protein [Pedobacter antarcticus]